MIRLFVVLILGIPSLLLILHTIVRIVRTFYKFPMPQFLANVIDNPFRRIIQPPAETADRHGISEGMTILEVGPGNGTYTTAAAQKVGSSGKLITIDIEPKIIANIQKNIKNSGLNHIEARLADVYELPFSDNYFDLIYMIAVIGEIPSPEKAIREFHRTLSPTGTLVFSELLIDPDYPCSGTLMRMANRNGFRLRQKVGNFFYYTLIFEKA